MRLVDAKWASPVNVLLIACDPCGISFERPSSHSLVQCPKCGICELWHSVDPVTPGGYYGEPVMKQPQFVRADDTGARLPGSL